jgi:hypothetical protein
LIGRVHPDRRTERLANRLQSTNVVMMAMGEDDSADPGVSNPVQNIWGLVPRVDQHSFVTI